MTAQEHLSSQNHHVCTWWLAYTFDNPVRKLFHNPQKIFDAYIKEGMTVMDVGCGMGYFSMGMARLVGAGGKVIAVDLQQKMIDVMLKRARRAGVANRIISHCCEVDKLGVEGPADFILAFWMVHEAPNQETFLTEVRDLLGHSTITMTERYAHLAPENIRAAVKFLEGDRSRSGHVTELKVTKEGN